MTLVSGKPASGRPYLLFLLAFSFVAVVAGWPYLFGGRAFAFVDIGSDSFLQFYPFQILAADAIRDGTLFSNSFRIGLGAYPAVTHDIGLLAASIFPSDWQLSLRIYKYLFMLVAGGSGFYAYLCTLGLRGRTAALGAFAYAFNGYALVNAQWDPHGVEYAVLPLMLIGIELALRDEKPLYAVAIGLISTLEHTFSLFSNVVLIAAYALIRWYIAGYRPDIARYVGLLICIGACYGLGILLMAPIVLPKLWYLLDSPRVSGSSVFDLDTLLAIIFNVNSRDLVAQQLIGFFHKDIFGIGDNFKGYANYFEAPSFYVGIWALLAVPQLLTARRSPIERRLLFATLMLVVAYIVFPAVRQSVFLFGHVAFRTSTLWLSTLVLLAALFALRRVARTGIAVPLLAITATTYLAGLGIAYLRYGGAIDVIHLAKAAAFVAIYTFLLLSANRTGGRRVWALFAVIVLGEALFFAYPAMYERKSVDSAGQGGGLSYVDPTLAALNRIREEQAPSAFYRVAKDYSSAFLCDALVQRYRGFKTYFFNGSSYTRFVEAFGVRRPVPSLSYAEDPVHRLDVMRLLGVRYLLTGWPDRWNGNDALEYVGAFHYIHAYRLRQPPVYLYDRVQAMPDASKAPPPGTLDMTLYTSAESVSELERQLSHTQTLPSVWTRRAATLSSPRDDQVVAQTDSDRAAVLLLPIAFDPGWRVRIDGVPAATVEVDYGLTGIALPPGRHRVEARYVAPLLVAGCWVAAAGAATLMMLLRRRRRIAV